MKFCLQILLSWVVLTACTAAAQAQTEGNPFDALNWKRGPTTARVGQVASQTIGEGVLFLEAADARKFLELNQNPASESDIGIMVAPESDWWARYSYSDIGYVSDNEKGSLDSGAILQSLKEGTSKGNVERRRRGWPELTVLGWAREPHYDEKTHNLEWATRLSYSDGVSVNYNTRILGRGGVMSVVLVCPPERLDAVLPEFKAALRGFGYTAGNRYSEYRKGDRAAEVGLSALIVGGAAAAAVKTGAFKWLWKGLVFVLLALGGFLKKLAGGGKKGQ